MDTSNSSRTEKVVFLAIILGLSEGVKMELRERRVSKIASHPTGLVLQDASH